MWQWGENLWTKFFIGHINIHTNITTIFYAIIHFWKMCIIEYNYTLRLLHFLRPCHLVSNSGLCRSRLSVWCLFIIIFWSLVVWSYYSHTPKKLSIRPRTASDSRWQTFSRPSFLMTLFVTDFCVANFFLGPNFFPINHSSSPAMKDDWLKHTM